MFELKVYSNGFQILQQPEDIRRGCGVIYTSSTGCYISSIRSPAAGENCLYLRGTHRDSDRYLLYGQYFYSSMRALEEYCQFVSEKLVIKLGE